MDRVATLVAAIAMENAAHSNGPLISGNILYPPLARVFELGFHFIGPGFHQDRKPTRIVPVAVFVNLQQIRTAETSNSAAYHIVRPCERSFVKVKGCNPKENCATHILVQSDGVRECALRHVSGDQINFLQRDVAYSASSSRRTGRRPVAFRRSVPASARESPCREHP
jgi:hypothetical protein